MGEKIARILLAAPASGSGKTSLTCALLEAFRRRGRHPVSFKCGPDYIDPMFHRSVQQVPSWNLDSFFTSRELLCSLFQQHARQGDIAVLEGVMGYYDGIRGTDGKASSYEIACLTDSPVLLLLNGKAEEDPGSQMDRILSGRKDHHIAGVLINRADPCSADELVRQLKEHTGIPILGVIPDRPELTLASRHLGLCQPQEDPDTERWITAMADLLEEHADVEGILNIAEQAGDWETREEPRFSDHAPDLPVKIAVARDEAFSFYYEENLELLRCLGAEILEFSPLHDAAVPEEADGILLGGGYPELHAAALAENETMQQSLRRRIREGMPVIAECGGFLYLQRSLRMEDTEYAMTGVFPGNGEKKERLVRFGYMEAELKRGGLLGPKGAALRGHEFHYLDTDCNGTDLCCRKVSSGLAYEAGFCTETMYGGFPHFYFYGCPDSAAEYIRACRRYQVAKTVQKRWDTMGKPIDGLGKMEQILKRISAAQIRTMPELDPGALVVFCADHGVTAEQVTQTSSSVTRIVAENCASGHSTVNILARNAQMDVYTVDVGMLGPEYPETSLRTDAVISRRVRSGSGNIAEESAMTEEECGKAMEAGRTLLAELKESGYRIVSMGEMGIGNTTPSAVLAGLLLDRRAEEITGRGAGLPREGLDRKVRVVQKTMDRIRKLDDQTPERLLQEGGGLEIAAMTGLLLEAQEQDIPVVLDGAITMAAAALAVRIDARVRHILIASHDPREPAGHALLEDLQLPSVISGELSLGEGTGAMLLIPMLRGVRDVYEEMGSFQQIHVTPYERYETEGDKGC